MTYKNTKRTQHVCAVNCHSKMNIKRNTIFTNETCIHFSQILTHEILRNYVLSTVIELIKLIHRLKI